MVTLASLMIATAIVVCGYLLAFKERRYTFINPVKMTRTSIRLSRNWRRKPGPSAQIMFENRRDGGLLQITPLPKMFSSQIVSNLEGTLKGIIQNTLSTSVETKLEPQIFEGRRATITYVVSTDRNVQPGEWRFKLTGVVFSGEMSASVTALSHVAPPLGLVPALKALSTLRMSPESNRPRMDH